MSDYNLGTAHGRIVLDYEDKGSNKAVAALEAMKAKAAAIGAQMGKLSSSWYRNMDGMASDVTRWGQNIGVAAGALYFATAGTIRFSNGINGLKGASNIFSAIGLSMGKIPKGAETFPKVILDIIRLTAAVSVIQGSIGLLGQLGAKFATLRFGGAIFSVLGAAVTGLGIKIRSLSFLVGGLGQRFAALAFLNPIFFSLQGMLSRLGLNIGGVGRRIGQMTLGLTGLARGPAIAAGLNSAISKLVGPFAAVSKGAMMLAASFMELAIAKKLLKPLMAMQGALGGLNMAVTLAHSLGAEIARLGGLLPLAVGALFSLAAAGGIAMVAFKGLGEAIKSGDISKLAPEAGKAVTAIRGLKPEWDKFRSAIQGSVFEGVGAQIDGLKGRLAMMTPAAQAVGASLNGIVKEVIAFAKSTVAINNFSAILAGSSQMLDNLKAAIWPILEALTTIGAVGSQVFAEITSGAGGAASRFRDFINAARDSGQLRAWMMAGVQSIKDLWGALKALKSVWDTVRAALSPGEVTPFFAALKDGALALDRFLKSAQGQEVLGILAHMMQKAEVNLRALAQAFMDYCLPAIKAFLPYAEALATGAIDGIIFGLSVLSPAFQALGAALSFLAPVFEPIMAFMVKSVVLWAGLILFLGIASKAIFMLKYALSTLQLGFKIAVFMGRLFTGTLKGGQLAAVNFAKTLIANMVKALWLSIKAKFAAMIAMVKYVAVMVWGAITTAAKWVWAKTLLIMQWVLIKVAAAANAIKTAVVWVVQTIVSTTRVVLAWIITRLQIFAIWLSLVVQSAIQATTAFLAWAVQSIIQTARMIIAWIIARVQIAVIWISLVVQSAINATIAFATWAIQSIIATARMVLSWVIARTMLLLQWMLIRISALVSAIAAFIPWVIQSTIATGRMVLAWVLARTMLLLQWILIKVSAMVNAIMAFIPWVIQSTIAAGQMVIAWVIARVQVIVQWVIMAVQSMVNAVRVAIAWVIANAPAMGAAIMAAIAALAVVGSWIMMALGAMANAIMMAAAWFVALGPVGWVIAIIVGLVILIIANWDKIKSFTMNTWNTITQWITTKINQAKAIVSSVITAIVTFFTNGWNRAKAATISALAGVVASVASGIARVLSYCSSLPGKIKGFFSAAGRWLIDAGKAILTGLLDGLKAAWQASADFLSGLGAKIKSLKGPIDKDRKLLIPEGLAIMVGLCTGLMKGMPMLKKTLGTVTKSITTSDAMRPVLRATANGGAAAGGVNAAISTWNPYDRPTGAGVNESGPTNDYSGMSVTIPASDLKEMQNITDFFDKVTQTARAGSDS